jgi:hypothetical protein
LIGRGLKEGKTWNRGSLVHDYFPLFDHLQPDVSEEVKETKKPGIFVFLMELRFASSSTTTRAHDRRSS